MLRLSDSHRQVQKGIFDIWKHKVCLGDGILVCRSLYPHERFDTPGTSELKNSWQFHAASNRDKNRGKTSRKTGQLEESPVARARQYPYHARHSVDGPGYLMHVHANLQAIGVACDHDP